MNAITRKNWRLVLTLIILVINVACEKGTEYDLLTGQLIGYVSLYDNHRIELADKSGVEVIVEGSNPEITAITDENGRFILENLKSGIYNIVFNKDGFCQHKIVSFQFVGGNKPATLHKTNLYTLPEVRIDNLILNCNYAYYNYYVDIWAFLSNVNANSVSSFRFYLGNAPDISYKNYMLTGTVNSIRDADYVNLSLKIDTLKFPLGSELYMVMYPSTGVNQYYIDIDSGKRIYTSINQNNSSNVANITIAEPLGK